MRICNDCQEFKSLDKFYNFFGMKNGAPICKKCNNRRNGERAKAKRQALRLSQVFEPSMTDIEKHIDEGLNVLLEYIKRNMSLPLIVKLYRYGDLDENVPVSGIKKPATIRIKRQDDGYSAIVNYKAKIEYIYIFKIEQLEDIKETLRELLFSLKCELDPIEIQGLKIKMMFGI